MNLHRPFRRRAALLAASLALALCSSYGAPRALAQAESAEYRALIDQALSEYGANNYAEASALFTRAHELSPSARTLRGMGMAAFELKRYHESVAHLEAALASKARPLEGELRQETEALLLRAKTFVATVAVRLAPEEASLSVDGEAVRTREKPLILPLGPHTLLAEADGYEPLQRELTVRGGEQLDLSLSLRRAEQGAPLERVDAKRPLYKNPWLWSALGVVVVGAAVTSALLLTRDGDDVRTLPQPSANSMPGEFLSRFAVRP